MTSQFRAPIVVPILPPIDAFCCSPAANVMFEPNMNRRIAFSLAALLLCSSSFAQAAAGAPAASQAILAGKLIDVRTGDVRAHAYIVIAGDRVQAIADAAPSGLPIIDLSSYTVLPGLI